MKADKDNLFCDSTLVPVRDSKTFECNDSVFDTAEEKPTMKETQNGILSHSNGYEDEDSLGFPTKKFEDSNDYHSSKDSFVCDTKDGNEFWEVSQLDDSIFFDDISKDVIKASNVIDDQNQDLSKIITNKRGGNPFECDTDEVNAGFMKDDKSGDLSNIITGKRSGNPFECDTKDRDQPWNIPEFECSKIVDFLDDKENGAVDSVAPFTSNSEFFETNTNFYTDKGVTEYEMPELIVCYKEGNYNTVKDICMDEGVPAVDKILTESWKEDQPSTSVAVGADEDKQSDTRGSVDSALLPAGVSKASSVEDADNIAVTRDTVQESTGPLVPNEFKLSSEDNVINEDDKDSYLEDLMKIFGSKRTTKGNTSNDGSEKASSANNMAHLDESDVRNSQKANSIDDQSALQPDKMPSEQSTLKSQFAVSAADATNNDGPAPASNLLDNSKTGTGASTFDLHPTKPELTKSTDEGVENLPEDTLKSEAISGEKDGNADDLSATTQAHVANSVKRSSDNVQGQSLESQNVANLDDKPFGQLPIGVQGHFADGEASFSAAGPPSGLITYSGPISYSGSISLRSDSSTTSARSFAFPVLQSEWNSSPVRMAKADKRRFQKHKGWRQNILCCRF